MFSNGITSVIGMVHVQALLGTPYSKFSIDEICQIAVEEALLYKKHKFDGIILENMHDRPYLKGAVGPEIVAGMTRVASEVKKAVGKDFPVGIQILAGANLEALSVALIAQCEFVRAEGCVFGHVADEGWIEACAGPLLRERKRLGGENIKIITDVQKKHSAHSVTSDLSLEDWIHGAEFFGMDGVILSGKATGKAASAEELLRAKATTKLPIIIGSGITVHNAKNYKDADAWIVGSSVKENGYWENPIDVAVLDKIISVRNDI